MQKGSGRRKESDSFQRLKARIADTRNLFRVRHDQPDGVLILFDKIDKNDIKNV
jgi:hypothetical protein